MLFEDRRDGEPPAAGQRDVLPGRPAAAGVLHDLGQPLAGIRALSSAPLPGGDGAAAADELRDRLSRIRELGEWMDDLLRDGWATVPGERPPPTGRDGRTDAAAVIHQVLLTAAASFAGTLRWRPSGPVLVAVDSRDLRRAVGNVVDNATRAAGPEGRVVIRTRRAGARFVIEVEDSGPGFGRVPSQRRHGLVVTRRILDGCGGALELGNRGSGGARVRLTLPTAPSPAS